jgi:hypothetical protein
MAKNGVVERMVLAAGVLLLYSPMAKQVQAQTQPQAQEQTQTKAQGQAQGSAVSLPRAARGSTTRTVSQARRRTPPPDDFAGLTFTDEQKARMDKIREDMKPRFDAVVQDTEASREQKAAMIEGLMRTAHREVFELLTPEQQAEVDRKILARRTAEQAQRQQKQLAPN